MTLSPVQSSTQASHETYVRESIDDRIERLSDKVFNKYTLTALGASCACVALTTSAPVVLTAGAIGGLAAYFSEDIKNKTLSFFTKAKTQDAPMTLENARAILEVPEAYQENYDYIDFQYRVMSEDLDELFAKASSQNQIDTLHEKQKNLESAHAFLTERRYTL